jgi:anti-sigma factor RsiW
VARLISDRHVPAEVLSAYLDGELRSGELDLVVDHLAGCEVCIAEFHELKETRAWLRTLPELAVPDRVMRAIHYGPELSAFLDGELGPAEHREVTNHLAGCEYCRDELQELDAARVAIRSLPGLEPPIMLGVEARRMGRARRWKVVTVAAGVAAALVIALGVVASGPEQAVDIDLDSFADRHVARASVEPGFAVIPAVGPTGGTP